MRFSRVAARLTAVVLGASLIGAGLTGPSSAASPRLSAAPIPTAPAGKFSAIAAGSTGWDTLNVETPTQIACLKRAGYTFDMINTNGPTWQNEYNAAAAAGLKVVLFQGYDQDAWVVPSQATTRAAAIRNKARAAKYPLGAEIYLNVENNLTDTSGKKKVTPAAMLSWINTWAAIIRKAGFIPGLYIGSPQVLSTAQVNSIQNVLFWRSVSSSAPQAARGFTVRQLKINAGACSIPKGIDINVAGADLRKYKLIGARF